MAMTHVVLRHGIQASGGRRLAPGERVDVSGWRASAVRQFLRRGLLAPLTVAAAPAPARTARGKKEASNGE